MFWVLCLYRDYVVRLVFSKTEVTQIILGTGFTVANLILCLGSFILVLRTFIADREAKEREKESDRVISVLRTEIEQLKS